MSRGSSGGADSNRGDAARGALEPRRRRGDAATTNGLRRARAAAPPRQRRDDESPPRTRSSRGGAEAETLRFKPRKRHVLKRAGADDDFDGVAGLIGASERDRVELTLGRRVGTVRIIFPNGAAAGGLPGAPLRELAASVDYPVKYGCTSGSCGVCEHRLRTPGDDSPRYTRLCVARVPRGSEVAQILPGDRYG